MNPSTDKIVQAILATPAKTVYVFPNNKNIIMSAQQAVSLVKDRVVIIIPSKTIPQGISAMLSFDAGLSAEENLNAMTSAMARVKTRPNNFRSERF